MISSELEELAANIKEYCQFLGDELINLKGARRHLETLAAKLKQIELLNGGVAPSEGGATPRPEKEPGNRCNFPVY